MSLALITMSGALGIMGILLMQLASDVKHLRKELRRVQEAQKFTYDSAKWQRQ